MKNKETVLFVVVALVVGLLVGVIFSKGKEKGATQSQVSSAQSAPQVNVQQTIKMLEGVVATDPKNRNAWVELGNTYFDSQQPMKSIDAYTKALELNGNDPNVLTDRGVMYRQLGWFDKAIDDFKKANQVDPRHIQSLYNLGVVYRYDLQDFVSAREAWKRYLEISPTGPSADKIRELINEIDTQPVIPPGQMRLPDNQPK